jgi:integrase/recombinase XerD
MQTLLDSGVRITEACALNVVDVTIEPPLIKIAPGKNRTAREIPLTYEAAGLLKQYLDTRTDNYPTLFITRLGKRFTRQGLHKLFTKYLDLVGIKAQYSTHSCRWRFGTRLADNEFELQDIAALLGHSQLQSSRRYVNMSDEKKSQLHKKYNQD